MDNLNEIIEASDGIMVARGDLGIEIPTEKVFIAQKTMIARCNKQGKPVICATQMLESMIKKPRPTRAESSDVANAVLDGADCVMLSGETAKGDYPLECVRTMSNICKEAEAAIWQDRVFYELVRDLPDSIGSRHAVAIAVVVASIKTSAAAILTLSTSGLSAQLISKYHPACPIIVVTRIPHVARQVNLHRGVVPFVYKKERNSDWLKDVEERTNFGIECSKKDGYVKGGDRLILMSGWTKDNLHSSTMRIIPVN